MAFDIVVIIGALCGLLMVGGSIYLLRTGAVKLASAPREGALAVEFAKQVKITTSYPALGLFVIGLLFVLGSAYLARPRVYELPITGTLSAADPSGISDVEIEIFVPVGKALPNQKGEVSYVFLHQSLPPNLYARVIASGYSDYPRSTFLTRAGDEWNFEYSLGRRIGEKPPEEDRNIVEDPGLPPLDGIPAW